MNRGHVLPVQQMVAAGNPNWWSMMRPPPPLQHQHQPSFSSPFSSILFPQHAPSNYYAPSSQLPNNNSNHFLYDNDNNQDQSLSQLLLGGSGLVGEEVDNYHQGLASNNNVVGHVKQETSSSSYNNIYEDQEHATWSLPHSPKSCLNKVLTNHPPPDRSSESNSSTGSGSGGPVTKKARVQTQSSTTFKDKVRKEKLGDRITTLHQLVSPFGKTDTASVLLESIGYIRFLQNQIEALSLPYLGNGSGNIRQHHHKYSVQGEGNGIFPEDPGQACNEEPKRELRSKGLCLVPVSCTLQVGSDNGADYWAPATLGRGGFQ